MPDIAILLLEDSLELGALGVTVLGELGYQDVRHVVTVADAVSVIEREDVGLCILDIHLEHGTSEAAALTAIRRNVPVIVTSGGEIFANFELANACHFLQKPASPDDLARAVAHVLA